MLKIITRLGLTLAALAGLLPVSAGAVTITFMHYNDLHAHLAPHADLVPDGPVGPDARLKVVERGGMARLATLVKQIRAENPNSVLMNIGDTFHGGVEAMFTVGNAIVSPVNALGIDVGVPGNWDFAYGPFVFSARYTDATQARLDAINDPLRPNVATIERPNFPNLAANMKTSLTGEPVLPPTLVKTVGGVKIGFIGLTSDIVKQMYPLLAPNWSFTQGETDYKNLINTQAASLRQQGCKIVVVMSELGIHKDYRLAQVVGKGTVDVFFSAHTHEATFTALTSASGALVVEAGNDGYLGRMDVTVGKTVTGRSWKLIPIDRTVAEDPTMSALVAQARAPFLSSDVRMLDPTPNSTQALTQPITTPIGYTGEALDRRHALESNFNNAYTDLLRQYGQTTLAMAPGFRFDSVVAAPGTLLEDNTVATGVITLEDVYRFFPMPMLVATANVDGKVLRELAESALTSVYSPAIFNQGGGWTHGFSGLSATVDLAAADGNRVKDLRVKQTGAPITDSSVLSITGCKRPVEEQGRLCSYPGFSNVTVLTTPAGQPWTLINLLADAITKALPYNAARRDITDLNHTPVWPQTPYIQPLTGTP